MPIKSEFGFRIDFANDPAPVHALKAVISTRRPLEVTQADPIAGRGRYVGVIFHRRGDDPLQAVQASVREMEAAGLQVTAVRGVARNGNARTPSAPLDEVTQKVNAWIADPHRQTPDATPRPSEDDGRQPSRSERIAWLQTCVDRIIDDGGGSGDDAFGPTPVGAEAEWLRRELARAQDAALSPGIFRLFRNRLIAFYLCCCERDRSEMADLTQSDINQMEFHYSPSCISLWRGRRTPHGRVEAIRKRLDRGTRFDDQLPSDLDPTAAAADIVDLLDATADLDQQPHGD